MSLIEVRFNCPVCGKSNWAFIEPGHSGDGGRLCVQRGCGMMLVLKFTEGQVEVVRHHQMPLIKV